MHNYLIAKAIKQFHVLSIEYTSRRLVKDVLLIQLPDSGPTGAYCKFYSLCH